MLCGVFSFYLAFLSCSSFFGAEALMYVQSKLQVYLVLPNNVTCWHQTHKWQHSCSEEHGATFLSKGCLTFMSYSLQSIQQDYTSLLSCLIQTFPANPEFRDLVQLTNRHDPDMDFFENMKHMQVKGNAHSLMPLTKAEVFYCGVMFSKSLMPCL